MHNLGRTDAVENRGKMKAEFSSMFDEELMLGQVGIPKGIPLLNCRILYHMDALRQRSS